MVLEPGVRREQQSHPSTHSYSTALPPVQDLILASPLPLALRASPN